MDDLDIVQAWQRRHSDGTLGVINGYRNGTFSAGLERPTGMPGVYGGSHGPDLRSYEAARASADRDAAESGHTCDARCEEWHELLIGSRPQY